MARNDTCALADYLASSDPTEDELIALGKETWHGGMGIEFSETIP